MDIKQRITHLNWDVITENINQKGYAHTSQLLTAGECDDLISQYANAQLYRKTVIMERHNFGLGEYKYYQYPLPLIVQQLRETVYPHLAPIANNWMRALNIEQQFPDTHEELLQLCKAHHQHKPTALILKYEKGGYNALHQDLYGEVYFPMQLVLCLNEPEKDFQGGEFVLIEQRPRAQSKAIVLTPRKGDMLLFTTNFRPVQGTRGYYRVNMKHGVSEVTDGQRHTAGIIFHDAG